MVQLGVLLTQYHRLLSVAAILDVFETVNSFYEEEGRPPFFSIAIVNDGSHPNVYGRYQTQPPDNRTRFDLLLIPAFGSTDMKKAIGDNAAFINFICTQRRQGTAIGSVCTGA